MLAQQDIIVNSMVLLQLSTKYCLARSILHHFVNSHSSNFIFFLLDYAHIFFIFVIAIFVPSFSDFLVKIVDRRDMSQKQMKGHNAPVLCVAFCPDNQLLVSRNAKAFMYNRCICLLLI